MSGQQVFVYKLEHIGLEELIYYQSILMKNIYSIIPLMIQNVIFNKLHQYNRFNIIISPIQETFQAPST